MLRGVVGAGQAPSYLTKAAEKEEEQAKLAAGKAQFAGEKQEEQGLPDELVAAAAALANDAEGHDTDVVRSSTSTSRLTSARPSTYLRSGPRRCGWTSTSRARRRPSRRG